jgi:DNA end-binding protein Ku
MAEIQKKVEGQDITTGANIETGGDKIIDLMEALKASLAKSKASAESDAASASEEKPKKQKVS